MDDYIGIIKIFAGEFAPRGWAFCKGQLLSISSNSALFSLLGTTYGGDGRATFGLPDLQGRAPIGIGHGPGLTSRNWGERGGEEMVTLTTSEMPVHNHLTQNTAATDQHILLSTEDGVNALPLAGDIPAIGNFPVGLSASKTKNFGPITSGKTVNGQAISGNTGLTILNNGGSRGHNNIQPFLAINYIIALQGIFPSRS